MKNYKVQDGCWNCKTVFRKSDYDEADQYFCNVNNSKRPLCLSCSMKNELPAHDIIYSDLWYKLSDLWGCWSKKHEVKEYGKCDLYIKDDRI